MVLRSRFEAAADMGGLVESLIISNEEGHGLTVAIV